MSEQPKPKTPAKQAGLVATWGGVGVAVVWVILHVLDKPLTDTQTLMLAGLVAGGAVVKGVRARGAS